MHPILDDPIDVQGEQAGSSGDSDNYDTNVEAPVDDGAVTCKKFIELRESLVDKSNGQDWKIRDQKENFANYMDWQT